MSHTGLPYIGRFAPSPTGPLHAGSLVAALASWLDARAQGGQWLVRMEDVDEPRCIKGMDAVILSQLAAFGLRSDGGVVYQSRRTDLYEAALSTLKEQALVYRCYCSRKAIGQGLYLGTCRQASWNKASQGNYPTSQYAYRFQASDQTINWQDRRQGIQTQNVAITVGDFIVKRADGLFAYQLAVVVDDAEQGITHIVRGEDLADNTARQIMLHESLYAALGLSLPRYLHVPLVRAVDGQKLSKQNGAQALDTAHPMAALNDAALRLGLSRKSADALLGESLLAWTLEWPTIWR
jgi:glutamyl-Q tRNA(Asp) synthetase